MGLVVCVVADVVNVLVRHSTGAVFALSDTRHAEIIEKIKIRTVLYEYRGLVPRSEAGPGLQTPQEGPQFPAKSGVESSHHPHSRLPTLTLPHHGSAEAEPIVWSTISFHDRLRAPSFAVSFLSFYWLFLGFGTQRITELEGGHSRSCNSHAPSAGQRRVALWEGCRPPP